MVRSVMEKLVIFYYDDGSRAGAVIESLANQYTYRGYLQCDGFVGYETAFKTNPEAAVNMSVICSLLATCKAHDVNPREYLNDVIAQMPYHKNATHEKLLDLLPHKWKLKHPESILTKQHGVSDN